MAASPLRRAVPRLLLPLLVLACRGERARVVRVGDAIPRSLQDSTLIDVIEPLLDLAGSPGMAIERWSLHDTQLNVAEAEQARVFALDSSIVAVVGHAGSKGTLLAMPIYRDARVPLVIPTATARELRGVPGLFMLAPTDDAVGAFLVDRALDSLAASRVAMVHVADAYGEGLHRGVVERLSVRGRTLAGSAVLTGRECAVDRLAARVSARSLLRRARPDVVILALPQATTTCLLQELVQAQAGLRIITADSYVPSMYAEITAEEREAVWSLAFWAPGPDSLSRRFVRRFRETLHRDPEPGQALAFDAYLLLRQAVREGHTTRASITQWLNRLGTPGHPPFVGLTGPIHFQAPRTAVLRLRHLSDPPAPE